MKQITLKEARILAVYDMPLPEAFYIDRNGDVQWKPGREPVAQPDDDHGTITTQ